jgi:ribosome biogenesis GTPase
MKLQQLGWDQRWQSVWKEQDAGPAQWPARVTAQQKKYLRIAGEFGECWAEVAGRMQFAASREAQFPVAGDWVAAAVRQPENRGTIHAILPRRTRFARHAAGRRTSEQVIAANVDIVFLMLSLNNDLNPRRLERYLAAAWDSGASPVVVLTKMDLCATPAAEVRELERSAMGVPVHAVSAQTGEGLPALYPYFRPGQTVALLGSSGVGKSTLLNRLVGRDVQAVREIRQGDDRGRHATTARALFPLPQGGLFLDTPGLRELQLWDAQAGLDEAFADIEAVAAQCRFRDCTHHSEPGCAVQAALAEGSLDEGRLNNLRKLEREKQFQLRKVDVQARQAEQKRWKLIHRHQRAQYEQRRREGRDKQ